MPIDYSRQIGKKITTKGHQKICIDIENIRYIQYNESLSTIFLNDNSKVNDIKTLTSFEEEFSGMGFIRISRDTIINGKYITKIKTNLGKRIVYLEEIALNVSKRRMSLLKKSLYYFAIFASIF
jgi:DNA-binding LytR/AlgR family response regulator